MKSLRRMKTRYRHNGNTITGTMILRFLLPYLFFLLLPTVFSYIAYFEAFRNVQASIQDTQRVQLEKVSGAMEQAMGKIHDLVFSLGSSPDIARFLRVDDCMEPDNFKLMRRIQQELPPFQITNNLIFDYLVHFRNSDVIMSPQTLSFRLPLFYRGTLTYDGIDYGEWYSQCFDRYHSADILPPESVTYEGKSQRLVTYLQSIPMEYAGVYSGTVLVLLKAEAMSELLHPLLSAGSGWAYVMNEHGGLLAWAGPDHPENLPFTIEADSPPFGSARIENHGERYVVSYLRRPVKGWTYVAGAPRELMESRVIYIRKFSTAISLAVIVVGSALAVAGAYRISRPFRTIIDAIRLRFGSEYNTDNPLREIESAVGRLISSNEDLRKEIRRREPFVKAALFERTLLGEVTDPGETAALLSMMEIDPEHRGFGCLMAHLHGWNGSISHTRLEELNASRLLTKDTAESCFKDLIFCHETSLDRITLVIGSPGERFRVSAESGAKSFRTGLWEKYGIKITLTGGNPVEEIHDLYESYSQARLALETMTGDDSTHILWYSSRVSEAGNYHYPLELENMFMSSIRSGNDGKARQVLHMIMEENFQKRILSPVMARNLQAEIQGSFLKLAGIMRLCNGKPGGTLARIEVLGAMENRSDFISAVHTLIADLCADAEQAKRSHNSELADRIRKYMEENICRPSLGLQCAADAFGLSEVYFSQFFKEQMGENFSAYVTRIRAGMAKQLLEQDPGRSIKNVAQEVGYQNADTFRKAYKRIFGTNPTTHKRIAG